MDSLELLVEGDLIAASIHFAFVFEQSGHIIAGLVAKLERHKVVNDFGAIFLEASKLAQASGGDALGSLIELLLDSVHVDRVLEEVDRVTEVASEEVKALSGLESCRGKHVDGLHAEAHEFHRERGSQSFRLWHEEVTLRESDQGLVYAAIEQTRVSVVSKILPLDEADDTLSVEQLGIPFFHLVSLIASGVLHVLFKEVIKSFVGHLLHSCVFLALAPKGIKLFHGAKSLVEVSCEVAGIVRGLNATKGEGGDSGCSNLQFIHRLLLIRNRAMPKSIQILFHYPTYSNL